MNDGIELRPWTLDDRIPATTPAEAHAASLVVCQYGHDMDDRKALLEALGLIGGAS